ncbi:MAG: polysaccharide biosynthesis/export family protein [Thermoanaerobaculaceae bacterium]|nr:polysaccharide biosynthesis/export family protein [Thermoanaerobaculaceae bacterium]
MLGRRVVLTHEPRKGGQVALGVVLLLAAALPVAAQVISGGYRIGPQDLVEIRVFEVPELNIERRVSEEGTINLPLIGEVPVRGLTETELAERLKVLLETKYVRRASVTIQVKEFRSRPIAVIGAVRQPGNLAFSGRLTLLEALALAGGLAENHGETIFVLRRSENGLADQLAVSVTDLLSRGDPDVNMPIFANDVINVPAVVQVTVFCLGQVRNPGALVFKDSERITLLTAIARAGGLSERAASKVRIKRREADGREVELVADYKRIVAGKDRDVELREGDIVVVKESLL